MSLTFLTWNEDKIIFMKARALLSKGDGLFVFNHHPSCGRCFVISRSFQYIHSTWHTVQHKIKTCLTSICWVVCDLNQLLLSMAPGVPVVEGRINELIRSPENGIFAN